MGISLVSSVVSTIQHIGVDSHDSDDVRVEKSLLAGSSLLVILAAALWGILYCLFREPTAGLFSLAYSVVTLASLLAFARTRRYHLFLFSQLLLGLTIPLAHTILLGGVWNSSVVILWALACPIAALLYYPIQSARWWWLAYVVVIATAALLHPLIEHDNHLPPALRRLFFVFNLGSVSSLTLLAMYYFIGQKNDAFRLLFQAQQKSENLLLNVLPREIAAILKHEERTIADSLDGVSILFADMVGFTPLTAHMAPQAVVELLNDLFSHFDALVDKYGVEKIRTMGDNYMVAAGVPRPRVDHAHCLASLALEMQAYLRQRRESTAMAIDFRMGINSGSVVGGVIGRTKFVYDVWGDAVNIASRMESQGVAGKIQVAQSTRELICDDFILEHRGAVHVKGRGTMETWFLVGRKEGQAREYSATA